MALYSIQQWAEEATSESTYVGVATIITASTGLLAIVYQIIRLFRAPRRDDRPDSGRHRHPPRDEED